MASFVESGPASTCTKLHVGTSGDPSELPRLVQAPCTCSTASQHTPDEELKGDSDAAWQVPAATAGLLAAWPSAAAAEGLGSQAGTGSSTDPVIAVLFTLAVLALGVVTVGMGYLSLQQWQNGTQDNKDRVNAEAEERRCAPTLYICILACRAGTRQGNHLDLNCLANQVKFQLESPQCVRLREWHRQRYHTARAHGDCSLDAFSDLSATSVTSVDMHPWDVGSCRTTGGIA